METPLTIRSATEELIARIDRQGGLGDRDILGRLSRHPDAHLPAWIIEWLVDSPIAGVQIGIADPDLETLMFEIGDSNLINEINTEAYPGKFLFPRGYLAIGCGVEWAGDVMVIDTRSEDPPVYQVWHDVSQDGEELERAMLSGAPGTRLISPTLSNLLSNGLAEAPITT